MTTVDLLFEIGCEELPSSFVDGALNALPGLTEKKLAALRLSHGAIEALGTPRRLALIVRELQAAQEDLEEQVTGPPMKAAYRDGKPTKAAEAFAKKLGCTLDDLIEIETPKGAYLAGTRRETGQPSADLLPEALAEIAKAIPFRKSMRWGAGRLAFGRPIRWLFARLGEATLPVELGPVKGGAVSYGHRFLHPGEVAVDGASDYVDKLRDARVLVDPKERAARMVERLGAAAAEAGGELIEDDFLVGENLSLVEEPQVVLGSFEEEFLALPDEVILEVARGHQRYFGLRKDGALMPHYLAVVNTAENPAAIKLGNDRVMRARLADAQFFHKEDLKTKLVERREELSGIVFQKRLGSVLDKAKRIEALVGRLGALAGASEETIATAKRGAHLCKCDLVTWMVGEFPDLQGEVGRAYALEQDEAAPVADVIRDHYRPKGAKDDVAPTDAAALVALADRLDTLAGCFAIGLSPTGAADPYALRRACIGSLRTLLGRGMNLSLEAALRAAHGGFASDVIDLDEDALVAKLGPFFTDRLKNLLADQHPADVVDAALGVAADRPLDALARAKAIEGLDAEVRAKVGEVFKRANNIAKDAPEGDPADPKSVGGEVHDSEVALHDALTSLRGKLAELSGGGAYPEAFAAVAKLAPLMADYFDNVMVMADDPKVRENRLRLMGRLSASCSSLARLDALAR